MVVFFHSKETCSSIYQELIIRSRKRPLKMALRPIFRPEIDNILLIINDLLWSDPD